MSEEDMTAALSKKMNGKYKLDKSENFEEYLQARGANFFARKMATSMNPTMEVNIAGERLKLKIYVAVKTIQDVDCKFGEEVEGVRPDGTKIATICRFDVRSDGNGGKIVMEERCKDDEDETVVYERYLEDADTMVTTKYWVEEGKLMSTQKDKEGGEDVVTREMVDGDTVLMSMKHGEVLCKRFFKRVQ